MVVNHTGSSELVCS